MRTAALLLLALGCPALGAGPTVTAVPAAAPVNWVEFRAAAGRQLVLSAEEAATWTSADDGCDLTPDSTGTRAVFTAPAAGPYRVLCTTKAGTTHCLIRVGDGPPDPGPIPPPKPADPLRAKLLAAYGAEAAADKAERVRDLAELYRQAARFAGTAATAAELRGLIRDASALMFAEDKAAPPVILKGVRGVVGAELAALLPADAPLTPDQRAAAAALFRRLAETLDTF